MSKDFRGVPLLDVRTCNNTLDAGNRDVVVVCTTVNSPAAVSTFGDISLGSITVDVVQPDRSTTGAVRVTSKLSDVSAHIR